MRNSLTDSRLKIVLLSDKVVHQQLSSARVHPISRFRSSCRICEHLQAGATRDSSREPPPAGKGNGPNSDARQLRTGPT